tara:strand:+ start:185 stop:550 length:366 start_codon:yes stop_codon:yes gene_type:complete
MIMGAMEILSDMRTAGIANGLIIVFHIYVAVALEGLGFLIPVVIVGAFIAGAYVKKGKVGAGLLAVPTLGYFLLIPELINAITDEPGIIEYVLIPFWFATMVVNLFVIQSEWTSDVKAAES